MPISRVNSYTPGELARGDHVQEEFDSLISFVNNLETDKLDVEGGTVTSLTVSGAFTAQGSSIFNAGFAVNNQLGVFNAGASVAGGNLAVTNNINIEANIVMKAGGTSVISNVLSMDGVSGNGVDFGVPPTTTPLPVNDEDVTNKLYVDKFWDKTTVSDIVNLNKSVQVDSMTKWMNPGAQPVENYSYVFGTGGANLFALALDAKDADLDANTLSSALLFNGGKTVPTADENYRQYTSMNLSGYRAQIRVNSEAQVNNAYVASVHPTAIRLDSTGPSAAADFCEMRTNETSFKPFIAVDDGSGLAGSRTEFTQRTALFSFDNQARKVRISGDFTSIINIFGLPTSSAGLGSGDVWNNSGVLNII